MPKDIWLLRINLNLQNRFQIFYKPLIDLTSLSINEIESINGKNYDTKDILHDDEKFLVSLPGDEFKLKFDLPEISENIEYELFLSSKGYYLEWMRQEWLEEKDITRLRKMVSMDQKTWRELAIEFKSMEHEMEDVFWNSKYSTTE